MSREMCQTNVVEKIIKHVFNIQNFPENLAVYEKMWKKYGTARHSIEGNITIWYSQTLHRWQYNNMVQPDTP
jgi:hypothetical protein